MSTVLCGISVSRPCVRCVSMAEDIWHLRGRDSGDLAETKVGRELAREREGEPEGADCTWKSRCALVAFGPNSHLGLGQGCTKSNIWSNFKFLLARALVLNKREK